jgi:lipoprotein
MKKLLLLSVAALLLGAFSLEAQTQDPFISVWNTQNGTTRTGASGRDIAIHAIGTDYTIEWVQLDPNDNSEKGPYESITVTSTLGNPYILNVDKAGRYRVRIRPGTGTLEGFYMVDLATKYDHDRLEKIEHWGNNKWKRLGHAFYKASNLDLIATDAPDLSIADSISYMFAFCVNLVNENSSISTWNVSSITNMKSVFEGAQKFDKPLNNWITSNVTDMSSMFKGALIFNQSLDSWNVSKVKNMNHLFENARKFNQSLATWDIRSLEKAVYMLDNSSRDEGMDCLNYSATIIAWAANVNTPNNIILGADKRYYNRTAKVAHKKLTVDKHWNIKIDHLDPGCGGLSYYWVGTLNEDFGTGGNWDDGVIPPTNGIVEFATLDNCGKEVKNNMVVDGPDRQIGKLINETSKATVIPTDISLTVHGSVEGSSAEENAGRIIIKSAKDQPNGTFIVKGQPAGTPVYATVMMYSKARKTSPMTWKDNIPGSPTKDKEFTASYQWQYVGIPVESVLAVGAFYKGFVRRYDEKYNGDGTKFFQKWHDISTYDALTAFTGYELTKKTPETYYISGKLVLGNRTLTLTREAAEITTYTGSDETLKHYGLGQNIFGNSYTASIVIEKMKFPPEVEKTVYIYNTGSFAEWGAKHNIPAPKSEVNTPGQYIAIPQNMASSIMYGRIPSMQGFMLKFTNEQTKFNQPPAYITLEYNDLGVIRNGKPQRTPSYNGEGSSEAVAAPAKHSYMTIGLSGKTSSDVMFMFETPNTTDGFDNGYDGYKLGADRLSSAILFADTKDGKLQVSTTPSIVGQVISFRSNGDGEYRLTLIPSNLQHYGNLQLLDLAENKYIPLSSDTTVYNFTAAGSNKIERRFMIVNGNGVATDNDNPYSDVLDAYMTAGNTLVVNNMTSSAGTASLIDVSGRTLASYNVNKGFTEIPVSLGAGVYMVSLKAADKTRVVKVIVK